MSSLKEWAWHKTGRAVLWALLEAARDGELEEDWRVMWADRTAAALRVARAGDPDWWRGDAARHIRAVSPGQGWPRVGPVIPRPAPIPVEIPRLGPGLPGFDVIAVRRTAAAAAATAEPVGPSQEAGEKVLLALRDLADNDAEAWWAWEPARAGEVSAGQALRAWWCAALEVVGVEEAEELVQSRERAERMLQQREGHGDIAVLQGMKVWTRQADGVRELAQQRRDLITESATAAATTLHRATLQRATPGVGPVLSDWVAEATARARQWRDRDAADVHLAELTDPAYRERLERIPEYWS
ncbi:MULTISPECIES: hypothetical protein [Mycobacteriaceae]|jgi:hypothetical protein|uniref:Uncharacterized protein n=4 Tax=Mycobacteriaceae TaxID=1762 RepID=A0A1A3P900_MYCAS|nr:MULTISPECIES: hypothetical protein [Mycobacteriaceae]MCH2218733.1 hypothetical protein [Dechloromonas sp.]PJE23947.1 MAG: hypothetical protein CK431_08580 [Mycobacterium sp.]NVN51522.1 hypothetical protein [Mycolicibacterium hippocampi]OBK29067.1 hypothetical protein A5634_18900 [Mycobacterium asiaticum]OBK73604.1 hypothetical protein A5650_20365 [Mycobacterium sp. 1164985.4]